MRRTLLIITFGISGLLFYPVNLFSELETVYGLSKAAINSSAIKLNTESKVTGKEKKSLSFDKFLHEFKSFQYNPKVWQKVVSQKEKEKKSQPLTPQEGIEFNLPLESKLSITGRKLIALKLGYIKWKDKENKTISAPGGFSENWDWGMEQELQVKIKGKIGPKITVNVDYDDTKEKDKPDVISVVYKGYPEEVIQEAAFGDIDLTLPQTEFVAYNKKLFGGKVDAKLGRFRLLAIGSRTKGVSETKKFTGNTTFEKKELMDTQYIRRKYYKIYINDTDAPSVDSPIVSGSEEIYLDDKNATNNTNTNAKEITVEDRNGVTYKGWFDKLYPGQDYTIDYRTGVITFLKAIMSNYVIAASYEQPSGVKRPIRMIKDEFETAITRELKNYYNLGSTKIIDDPNKFVVKVIDLNRIEQPIGDYLYEVDYDFGILKFLKETPFPADVYNVYPVNHYLIYIEYRHRLKTYNLRTDIVEGSENVKLDGTTLQRDIDYLIDYDIGLITFLKEEQIRDDSQIEVNYEYMPFGGQFQQTIAGARMEYNVNPDMFVGSTVMYNWATSPSNIPDIRSTPESILVLEADSKMTLRPERLPILDWDLTGLKTEISGEIARSQYNPNFYERAMIDNMEGSEISDTMPTDRNQWRKAAYSLSQADRGTLTLTNGDEDIKTVNPNSQEEGRIQILDLNYNLPSINSWEAIVFPISSEGTDFSRQNYLEARIYGEARGEEIHFDLGRINEDADGTGGFRAADNRGVWPIGAPKTEDLNNNGILDVGEDMGWDFVNADSSITKIGAGNGRIDTEDLDGDGMLNTSENIPGTYVVTVNWPGWQLVTIPLNITSATQTDWQVIKHIRLWMKRGSNAIGTVRMTQLAIVGNRWDKGVTTGGGSFNVKSKTNEDDSNVKLEDNGDYLWLYNEVPSKDLEENRTLVLEYNLPTGSDGYTQRLFTKAQDYSKHKKLKLFVYGDGQGETFYMRIGANDSNYYQYSQDINSRGWQMLSISIPNDFTSKVGNPSFANISFIRLGIVGNGTSGEIWVDEIHLTDPDIEIDWAKKIALNSSYNDWGTVRGEYREKGRDFTTIGVPKVNQDVTTRKINSNITNWEFLPDKYKKSFPTNFSWDKTTSVTPSVFRTDLSQEVEGRLVADNLNVGTNFTLDKWPQVGLNFSRNNIDTNAQKLIQGYTYGSNLYYKMPGENNLLLLTDIRSDYKRTNTFTFYTLSLKKNTGYEDLLEAKDDWSLSPNFAFKDKLTLSPSYKRIKIAERKEFYSGDRFNRKKSDTQTVGTTSQLSLAKWLSPSFSYSITSGEIYNVDASSKNVNRSTLSEVRYPLAVRDILPQWKHLSTMNITNSYKVNEGDIYENVSSDYEVLNKLWIRERLTSGSFKSYSQTLTFETTTRWLPLQYFDLKGGWSPFKTVDTTTKYTKSNEHRITTGTPYQSYTKIWPDLNITLSDIEKFPKLNTFMENSRLTVKYRQQYTDKINIAFSTEDRWSTDFNGKFFKRYTLLLNLEEITGQDNDPEGVMTYARHSFNKNTQVNFKMLKDLSFIVGFEDKKQTERDRTNTVIRYDYTRTPSIKMEQDINFPKGLHLPFTRKVWQLKNALHLTTILKTILQRSNDVSRNTDTYSGSIATDYKLSYNFVFTFGLGTSIVKNKYNKFNDYYTVEGNFKLEIRF